MTRYRIHKASSGQWRVSRRMFILDLDVAAFPTWAEALSCVDRRIRDERGTQADYALAAPGGNR